MVRLSGIACLLMIVSLSSHVSAGWPFFAEDGLRRGSPEYYEAHANDPPGSRQKFLYGKVWPVRARPVGPEQTFVHKYHNAHYWPHPYNCQDRASVQAVCDLQIQNGWQTATTFYEFHFDEETQALNSAGQKHLAWLITHVPEHQRQAYVQIAPDAKANAARVQSLEESLAALPGGIGAIPVIPRATHPLGRPAAEVQAIHQGAVTGALPPVITYVGSGTSGGN